MFLNKFFHFLKGYVIIEIVSSNAEQFLCAAVKNGLKIWGIKRADFNTVILRIGFSDFFKIREIARSTRSRIRIKAKFGLPVIFKKYKRRYFLLGGAVLFALFMGVSSGFVWSVEIEGVHNSDSGAILQTLHDMGVYVGAPKRNIKRSTEIKNALLNRVDNITWAWVYLKGTRAYCVIYENSIPPLRMEDGVECNIIAARDGIIKRIIATDGKKTVKAGDTVCAGDLLISGVLLNGAGDFGALVEAGGIVEAKTWHEKTGTFKLYDETKKATGREKSFWTLKLFSKTIPLYRNADAGFDEYITEEHCYELKLAGDRYLGIALLKKRVSEVVTEKRPISYDMAVYAGKCKLEEEIAGELLAGSEKTAENLVHFPLDAETVQVTLTMEFTEKIGVKAPIEKIEENRE